MTKSILTGLGAVSAMALFWAGVAAADPAIWKASDEDSDVWLFGSVHVLEEGTRWKTQTLEEILDSAAWFYYETPTDAEAQAEIAQLIGRYGVELGGKKLTDYLDEEQTELLSRVAADLGVPLSSLQQLKPWLANLTLQIMFLQKSGYQPGAGVELSLAPLTPDEQERFFETAEEQIGFFTGLSEEASVDALVAALHQVEEQPKLFDKLVDAWEAGDLETLNALFNDAMKEAGPEVYQALVVSRNEAWVEEILAMMAGEDDALITVGAGHMVGEAGVPALLEAEGITVERIQ